MVWEEYNNYEFYVCYILSCEKQVDKEQLFYRRIMVYE